MTERTERRCVMLADGASGSSILRGLLAEPCAARRGGRPSAQLPEGRVGGLALFGERGERPLGSPR